MQPDCGNIGKIWPDLKYSKGKQARDFNPHTRIFQLNDQLYAQKIDMFCWALQYDTAVTHTKQYIPEF